MQIFNILRAIFGLTYTLPKVIKMGAKTAEQVVENRQHIFPFFNFFINFFVISVLIGLQFAWPNPFIFLATFLVQWVILRKVRKIMHSRAEEPDEVHSSHASSEVLSKTTPVLDTFTAESSMRNFGSIREDVIQRVRADFNRTLVRDTLIALGYFSLVLVGLVFLIFFANQGGTLGVGGILIGFIILASVIFRWLFLRNRYRPVDARWGNAMVQSPFKIYGQELARILDKGGTNLLVGFLIVNLIFSSISEGDYISSVGLILAAGLHFCFLVLLKPKAGYNIKLLLLRTFNIKENSLFTFGRLIGFWEHLGNYFTVVDASYLKHKHGFITRRTLYILLTLQILWMELNILLGGIFPQLFSQTSNWYYPVGFLFFVFATLLLIGFEYYVLGRSVIRNVGMIKEQLEVIQRKPRGQMDFTFKGMPTICHADTWRGTVAEMVKTTDIVLMDLRGFSEKKKGCEYELDFLLDSIPVKRVLILVDAKDDQEFIRKAILERWEKLKVDSPNLGVTDPHIQIYISLQQDEVDVQGIFDHLLGTAVLSGRVVGTSVS